MHPARVPLLSLCFLLCTPALVSAQPPPRSSSDVATPGPTAPPPPLFPNSTVGGLLTRHLESLTAVGETADRDSQLSLRRLRQEPEAVRLLQEAYARTPEPEYFLRWELVYTLASLGQREALAPLARIALTPIPPERGESPEDFTTSRESNIRVAAVDGLAALAAQGLTEADTLLRRLATHSDLSVRQRAVRGYLAAGPDLDARVKTMRATLPPEDQGLITLRTTDLRRVPHPTDTPEDLRPRVRRHDDVPTAR